MKKSVRLSGLPLFLFVFILLSCGGKGKNAGAAGGPGGAGANEIKVYSVLTITSRSTTLFSDYPSTIQGQQNIEIRPKIDGYIEKIYVDEGATVRKGQPLFQISAPQYEQGVRTAQANIKIAQADVNAAQMQVEKVRPLVEKNIISQYELQSAQFTLQAKQAALAQARASFANARTNLGYTSITSPVDGVVGVIPHKIGSLVSSNTAEPLTTVSNIGNIYAYFSINEKMALEFSKNTPGATVQQRLATIPPVTLILPNGTEFSQKGRIETASGLINTETGSISVRATFPNPGNIIRSGSSGVVRIPRTVDSALLIPQKATYEIQGKKFVYVVESTGTVRSVEVKVMDSNNGQYYVVQQGLNPGEKIVLEGVASLREGAAIKPREVNSDSVYRVMTNVER
ncbi:efflux RND transporter periplasmic adaptor subunit [Chitinophagaceae bacterium LB-8]|uniref:Efflux RND transporter periplasmic adaptor subunit n=1 Tax=Paraflavisolibacter caeni TaxID=2982496 RepID=A0A9X3B7X0_9BACT|nr:efflux RND transporter periplasmic adaptor subunit [Paraflavisolibacter caeni]MCU7549800.1 efflux RND transporter periplasmic adaptor subunit [Paraflavisolibacter caeni]